MDLVCPKCQGAMRTYERNGVHVDQCTECRGIFLDRGELERLIDAENSWHGAATGDRQGRPDQQHGTQQHGARYPAAAGGGAGLGAVVNEVLGAVSRGSSHGPSQGSSHGSYGHKKRKESFLSDLFG